jgi:TRAF3-interacting protein 1
MKPLEEHPTRQEEEKDPKFGFARLPSARKAQNNSLYNSKNMNELRQKIQKICQSANPLGKIIDFVYEDMDTMNKELVKWRSLHQKYTEEFEDAKNMTDKGLAPLSAELNKITTEITDQTKRVHRLKALIFKNDKQLQGLLEQHSGGDF